MRRAYVGSQQNVTNIMIFLTVIGDQACNYWCLQDSLKQ